MEILDLKVGQRNVFGKGPSRALRRQGFIPAVLYGPSREATHLTVSPADLDKIYRETGTEHVIFNLIIENGSSQNATAIVKEIQTSPVSREYLHIDFYEISLDKAIVVSVPVEATGKSQGVERGGLLQVVRHTLEVSCLPADMPDKILVDVSELDIGDAVHIGDLKVPDKVELLADEGLTVITVVAPTVVKEEVPEEEELEEGLEEAEEGAEEASEEASEQ